MATGTGSRQSLWVWRIKNPLCLMLVVVMFLNEVTAFGPVRSRQPKQGMQHLVQSVAEVSESESSMEPRLDSLLIDAVDEATIEAKKQEAHAAPIDGTSMEIALDHHAALESYAEGAVLEQLLLELKLCTYYEKPEDPAEFIFELLSHRREGQLEPNQNPINVEAISTRLKADANHTGVQTSQAYSTGADKEVAATATDKDASSQHKVEFGAESPLPGREAEYEKAKAEYEKTMRNGGAQSAGVVPPPIDQDRRNRSPGIQRNFYDMPRDEFRRSYGGGGGEPIGDGGFPPNGGGMGSAGPVSMGRSPTAPGAPRGYGGFGGQSSSQYAGGSPTQGHYARYRGRYRAYSQSSMQDDGGNSMQGMGASAPHQRARRSKIKQHQVQQRQVQQQQVQERQKQQLQQMQMKQHEEGRRQVQQQLKQQKQQREMQQREVQQREMQQREIQQRQMQQWQMQQQEMQQRHAQQPHMQQRQVQQRYVQQPDMQQTRTQKWQMRQRQMHQPHMQQRQLQQQHVQQWHLQKVLQQQEMPPLQMAPPQMQQPQMRQRQVQPRQMQQPQMQQRQMQHQWQMQQRQMQVPHMQHRQVQRQPQMQQWQRQQWRIPQMPQPPMPQPPPIPQPQMKQPQMLQKILQRQMQQRQMQRRQAF